MTPTFSPVSEHSIPHTLVLSVTFCSLWIGSFLTFTYILIYAYVCIRTFTHMHYYFAHIRVRVDMYCLMHVCSGVISKPNWHPFFKYSKENLPTHMYILNMYKKFIQMQIIHKYVNLKKGKDISPTHAYICFNLSTVVGSKLMDNMRLNFGNWALYCRARVSIFADFHRKSIHSSFSGS